MRLTVGAIASLVLTTALSTSAAVIERDWREPGDGLLTYDTINQREWLDLPESLLADFPGGVLAELEPGGRFDGFTWAAREDVLDLAKSAGIDIGTVSIDVNISATDALINLLGITALSGGNTRSSFGLVNDTLSPMPNQSLAATEVIPPLGHAGLRFVPFGRLTDRPHQITGVMLYRQIPEPSALLGSIVVCGLHLARGRRGARLRSWT